MTTQNVRRLSELDADRAKWRLQGFSGQATAGATTDIDWKFTEDRWLSGGELRCRNQAWGDKVTLQIVDKDNVLGYGPGLVLDTFAVDFPIATDSERQGSFECPYIALVPANIYARVKYTSTGGAAVDCAMVLITHIPRF